MVKSFCSFLIILLTVLVCYTQANAWGWEPVQMPSFGPVYVQPSPQWQTDQNIMFYQQQLMQEAQQQRMLRQQREMMEQQYLQQQQMFNQQQAYQQQLWEQQQRQLQQQQQQQQLQLQQQQRAQQAAENSVVMLKQGLNDLISRHKKGTLTKESRQEISAVITKYINMLKNKKANAGLTKYDKEALTLLTNFQKTTGIK